MKYRDWHNRAVELSEKGMSKHHEMVGKIFPTNNGGDCVVVEYINARNAKDSKEKEGNIKRTALVWKDKIGEDVFESLMNWTVD